MPTPLQILMDPVSLTVLALYGALILIEALFPARPLPRVKGWRTRALIVFAFYFFLSSYLPLLWGVGAVCVALTVLVLNRRDVT